jgi:hypothetical protein
MFFAKPLRCDPTQTNAKKRAKMKNILKPLLGSLFVACAANQAEFTVVESSFSTSQTPSPEASLIASGLPMYSKQAFIPPAKETERRLYSDKIEASSFLWTNWNKFQENYHPNYIMDGDAKTAWVEGTSTSGAGEFIKVYTSEVAKTTKIRVRVQSGYQKSKALFTSNTRPKTVELIAYPSKEKTTVTLNDAMGWQEITLSQKSGPFNAVELKVVDAYEGKKYTDLCISEIEIYATSETKENPSFEKQKLDSLLAWKKERVAASKAWKAKKKSDLPVASGYQIKESESFSSPFITKAKGDFARTIDTLNYLAANVPEAKAYADRARAAFESTPSSWVALSFSVVSPIQFPMVDGLDRFETGDDEEFYDSFAIPSVKKSSLLLNSSFSAFDGKEKHAQEFVLFKSCKKDETYFWRNPKLTQSGPALSEVIMEICQVKYERDSEYKEGTTAVLEYDDKGRLVLFATYDFVQFFTWKDAAGDVSTFINGGWKVSGEYAEQLTIR